MMLVKMRFQIMREGRFVLTAGLIALVASSAWGELIRPVSVLAPAGVTVEIADDGVVRLKFD